jgi:hypothetical protein
MQSKTAFYSNTDAATVAMDFNNGVNQKVTVAGNRTFTFSNPVEGAIYGIMITQDAVGSRTITFPSTVKWAGGSAPTLTTTASRSDVIYFMYTGTYFIDIAIVKNHNLA